MISIIVPWIVILISIIFIIGYSFKIVNKKEFLVAIASSLFGLVLGIYNTFKYKPLTGTIPFGLRLAIALIAVLIFYLSFLLFLKESGRTIKEYFTMKERKTHDTEDLADTLVEQRNSLSIKNHKKFTGSIEPSYGMTKGDYWLETKEDTRLTNGGKVTLYEYDGEEWVSAFDSDSKMYVTEELVINLTDVFGEGNVPRQQELDVFLKNVHWDFKE